MSYNEQLLDELNLLVKFPLHSEREGIKVHGDAGNHLVLAAERLHDKGLISQRDGGYLTGSGYQAVEHAKAVLTILAPTA